MKKGNKKNSRSSGNPPVKNGIDSPRQRNRQFRVVLPVVLIALVLIAITIRTIQRGGGTIDSEEPLAPPRKLHPNEWNILVVSLDTTRPDKLEACGGQPVKTPNLNRLRGDGFVFTEMVTPAPITLTAHSSLFTGKNPYKHGLRENTEFMLKPGTPTLASVFRENDYRTAAFVSAFTMNSRFGIDQGFEIYSDDLSGPERGLKPYQIEIPGGILVGRACHWINSYAAARRGGAETKPFFAFVHFFDAHAPYRPPASYSTSYPDPYNGELAYQDACLGQLLDTLEASGEASRTMIWVISDHGESLGEHGEATHMIFIYDCTQRIVSIATLPPAKGRYEVGAPRMTIDIPTGLIDVAPTLIDLCNLKTIIPDMDGRSLVPMMKGEKVKKRMYYCETFSPRFSYHWSPLYGIRSSEWKYILAPQPELYNLYNDPDELTNLIYRKPETAAKMAQLLAKFQAEDPGISVDSREELDEEKLEKLRSLGYLSGSGEPNRPDEDLPDPKEMIKFFRQQFQPAQNLMFEGKREEAILALKKALLADPNNNTLLQNLATVLRYSGRLDEAGKAYARSLAIEPNSSRTWNGWGETLRRIWQPDSAAWAYRNAIEVLPSAPDAWMGMGDLLWQQGKPESAAAMYDSSLARGGNQIRLHGLLARLYREELPDEQLAQRHLEQFSRLAKIPVATAVNKLPAVK